MSELDFSAVLAIGIHDMKNSLNRVLSAVDALSGCECGKDEQESLAQLQYEARRMKDNLTLLLTIYRHDHGMYEPNFAETNVFELLEDAWLNNKPMTEHCKLSFVIDCDEQLIWTLDDYLVTSLIENVLTNTIKYTRGAIRLSAREDGNWLCLSVDDDGAGFPAGMLGRRRLRDSAEPDAKLGSTGLGLHFCALVAERHRRSDGSCGFIELSNAGSLGGGHFELKLPALG
ncbi:Alginate biosynthesis sensor protein KinB [Thiorhodovibrio winogradskyi]|uniref:Alginate biosynthesis sensor protein KinB n=1 Tax=Thiorhodovibrio winogradskyi TaxID=77007 RepID=A0ABZ0S9E6_9GAMM|nr:HAMP domain-containing sensor histidine kinase [Thiorhodovibrio winogradskyi]